MQRRRQIELTAREFGRWRVIRFDGTGTGNVRWICVCERGAEHSVRGAELLGGRSRGCHGCGA